MNNLFQVKNINFVISGGLGQIGLKVSEYLQKNSSKLVILDFFDQKKLKLIKKKNPFLASKNIKILKIDISKKIQIKKSLPKILKFLKKINVLVNLAAIDANNLGRFIKDLNFHNFPENILKKSINTNLLGTINLAQVFCEYFVTNKVAGNIINVASTYSIVSPNLALYNKNLSLKNFCHSLDSF